MEEINLNFNFEKADYKSFIFVKDEYDDFIIGSRLDIGNFNDKEIGEYYLLFYHDFGSNDFKIHCFNRKPTEFRCDENYNVCINPNEYEKVKNYMKMKEKEREF